jgi:hypothetical protein
MNRAAAWAKHHIGVEFAGTGGGLWRRFGDFLSCKP